MAGGTEKTVLIGRITAAHGVRGWLKLKSFTDPADNILLYGPWLFRDPRGQVREVALEALHRQGAHFIARVAGCDDRDAAEALKGTEIHMPADALPVPDDDEFYWRDLFGLEVTNESGKMLGKVRTMMETGAHDVMVLDTGVLIPFADPYLLEVDRLSGVIKVAWQEDWA